MIDETTKIKVSGNPLTSIMRRPLVQAFFSDPITLISGVFLTLIFLAAIFAPVIVPHDPTDRQLPLRHVGPFSSGIATDRSVSPPQEEDRFYILGTDHLGRDMVSRLIFGARISLGVGVLGVLVSGFARDSDSPARDAGLQVDDIIVQLAGRDMLTSSDLLDAVALVKPGNEVTVRVWRDGAFHERSVRLIERP